MAKVILNVSMSLDGFITGPNDSVEVPMGEGGERLHEWMFKKSADAVSEGLEHRGSFRSETINAKLMKEMFDSSGAFLMGRADITRQLLKAALVDEMNISLVPVLLGRGRRLFDDTFRKYTELEAISVIEAPGVTHLRFRVIKNNG